MNAESYWERFIDYNYDYEEAKHTVWSFGNDKRTADRLLALVLAKLKTATTSLLAEYEHDGEEIPKEGDCSVILDSEGVPSCIIVDKKVTVVPFSEVTAEHAAKEGEGDLSLENWKNNHEEFFKKTCDNCGLTFSKDMKVVCEEFELIFR